MLLLPGLAIVLSLVLGGFSLGLQRIALEVEAFEAARHYSITGDTQGHPVTEEGRFSCVEVSSPGVIPLSAHSCMIRYGG